MIECVRFSVCKHNNLRENAVKVPEVTAACLSVYIQINSDGNTCNVLCTILLPRLVFIESHCKAIHTLKQRTSSSPSSGGLHAEVVNKHTTISTCWPDKMNAVKQISLSSWNITSSRHFLNKEQTFEITAVNYKLHFPLFFLHTPSAKMAAIDYTQEGRGGERRPTRGDPWIIQASSHRWTGYKMQTAYWVQTHWQWITTVVFVQ